MLTSSHVFPSFECEEKGSLKQFLCGFNDMSTCVSTRTWDTLLHILVPVWQRQDLDLQMLNKFFTTSSSLCSFSLHRISIASIFKSPPLDACIHASTSFDQTCNDLILPYGAVVWVLFSFGNLPNLVSHQLIGGSAWCFAIFCITATSRSTDRPP